MARGRNAKARSGGVIATTRPSEEQLFALHQYDKIVQLRDAVLSGSHPRIKLPTGVGAQPSTSTSAVAQLGVQSAYAKNSQSFASNAQKPGIRPESFQNGLVGVPPTGPRVFGSGRAEINPILLEKSDDLIRAELQIQRQRLERALRDEVEQRRVAKHTQAEPLADFDLSDVLAKALTLVQAAARPSANENLTANEAASDSFDDNTFYSSRHDTPESQLTSRVRIESEEVQAPNTTGFQQPTHNDATVHDDPADLPAGNQTINSTQSFHHASSANATTHLSHISQVPGLNNYVEAVVSSSGPSLNTSGEQSQSEDSGNLDIEQHAAANRRQQLNDAYAAAHPPSPLVRAHDLFPVAPQPSQVTPLAVARRLPQVADPGSIAPIATTGTPAQVAALRNEPGAITSPESSPQGGRSSDKKRGKKKKRKVDRQAPEAEVIPYIKAEPRSPSPIAGMAYLRPNKRQRHTQRPVDEIEYAPPRYGPAPGSDFQEIPQAHPYREERTPIGYAGAGTYPQRAASTTVIGDPRYSRAYDDDRRLPGEAYIRHHPLPGPSAFQYSPGGHLERPPSRVLNEPYMEPPHSYQEPYEVSRATTRPEGEFYMPPPRPQPSRIVVDASGREYIEPPRPSVRQSVAPPIRSSEAEILYERAPARAASRHPGPSSYEDGSVVYAGESPYVAPRRIVTQPEYVSQDYRDSRPREYSTRPMPPHGEYVQVMAPPDRRHVEEGPRGYIARATSMRPAEPVRYGGPQDYGRGQSVRPEMPAREYAASVRPDAPAREYAASVHPDGRREMAQPYAIRYGAPAAQAGFPREYSVRPWNGTMSRSYREAMI